MKTTDESTRRETNLDPYLGQDKLLDFDSTDSLVCHQISNIIVRL